MNGNHHVSETARSPAGREVQDIAVVGAGPVGLAAALGFARLGYGVTLVGPPPGKRDGRTAALLGGSMALLAHLGIWNDLLRVASPLATMRIVDDTDSLFRPPPVAFHAAEIGLEAFGWNIENAGLADILAGAVEAEPKIAWLRTVASGLLAGPDAALTLADGSVTRAHLVVAADGRQSPLRNAAGIAARRWSYGQRALTTLITHQLSHHDTSTEFHTRGGPFTLVPLPGRRSSLVWVMGPGQARRFADLDDAGLAGAIERQSRRLLGEIRIDGPRATVPLGALAVERFVARRLVLVGEAAHALPPIGAQGLNLGFADVAALLEVIGNACGKLPGPRPDPGDDRILVAYARQRRGDVTIRTTAVDVLNRSLLVDALPVDALRGLGLGALAQIGPLRRLLMRAGLAGKVSLTGSGAVQAALRSSDSR